MVNAHLSLKCPYSLTNKVLSKRLDMKSVSVILLQYQRQVLSENFRFISQKKDKSYRCVKNGML